MKLEGARASCYTSRFLFGGARAASLHNRFVAPESVCICLVLFFNRRNHDYPRTSLILRAAHRNPSRMSLNGLTAVIIKRQIVYNPPELANLQCFQAHCPVW